MYQENLDKTTVISISEEEFAQYHHHHKIKIIKHNDRYWEETFIGFYQPIHWMSRLTPKQATCPTQRWYWGFRCALEEKYSNIANGSLPVHLLTNIKNYDGQNLSSNRRNHLRRCHRRAKIVELKGTKLLIEQGYDVYHSAIVRTNYQKPLSQQKYRKQLTAKQNNTEKCKWLVLAGLIGDKLGGYLSGYAVNGTAYIPEVYIATEALSTYMGTGLVFEFIQACRRSGQIHEIVYGLHSREDKALCTFKKGMKFEVKNIPAKVKMNLVLKTLIRLRYPHKYYRLTGQK